MNWLKKYFGQVLMLLLALVAAVLGMQKLAAKQGKNAAVLKEGNALDRQAVVDAREEASKETKLALEAMTVADQAVTRARKSQKRLERVIKSEVQATPEERLEWLNKE